MTNYIVLERIHAGGGPAEPPAWAEMGVYEGGSSRAAINAYIATLVDPELDSVFAAVPARSFVATPVKYEPRLKFG
jgi:hypothetical protein